METGPAILLFLGGGVVGGIVAGVVAYLVCSNQHRSEILDLTERATQAEANLQAEHRANQDKMTALHQAEERLREAFSSLSSTALKENTRQFLDMVKEQLEQQQQVATGHLTLHKKDIDSLLQPLKTTLEQQQQSLATIEEARQKSYGSIEQQLKRMSEDQQRLQSETANLVKALRQPQVRGRWGEIQLKRVVELAGMHEYCDFQQQQSSSDSEGKQLRPDMLVRLPNQRTIVVDAKVPLAAYLEAIEANDEDNRRQGFKKHAHQIRHHVDDMNKRDYHRHISGSHDFTVLFIPGEVFYSAALEHDHELLEYAFGKKIILATPTTLIALLKAVAMGWQETRLAANAQHIRDLGEEIYQRMGTIASYMTKLGKSLNGSVATFNDTIGSMERYLFTSARRMHELQIGDKEIAETEPVEKAPRSFSKAELLTEGEATGSKATGGKGTGGEATEGQTA